MTGNTKVENKKGFGWWAIRLTIVILVLPIVMLGISVVNNQIATAIDKQNFPPPGEMVNVGGHNLHIYCLGDGSPTVILEAGANSWSVVWSLVQEDIAKRTRVCSYDRAGFGWSESGPEPRTAERLVGELHTLLTNAGIEGPYIMVGHSYGGPLVRLFTDQYPDEVVGVVLVDATHPDQPTRLPINFLGDIDAQVKQFQLLGTLAKLGFLRFGVEQNVPTWTLPKEVIPAYLAIMSRPEFYETSVAEATMLATSLKQVSQTDNLGDKPLIVLAAGQFDEELASYPEVDKKTYKAARLELQKELAALSTNSQLIVAEKSGHIIQLYQPELVIDAVIQLVEPYEPER